MLGTPKKPKSIHQFLTTVGRDSRVAADDIRIRKRSLNMSMGSIED